MSGKLDGHCYAGTLKKFHSTHIGYRAHRAVIFAIAWHLVRYSYLIAVIIMWISFIHSKSHTHTYHYNVAELVSSDFNTDIGACHKRILMLPNRMSKHNQVTYCNS